jgi:transposase
MSKLTTTRVDEVLEIIKAHGVCTMEEMHDKCSFKGQKYARRHIHQAVHILKFKGLVAYVSSKVYKAI